MCFKPFDALKRHDFISHFLPLFKESGATAGRKEKDGRGGGQDGAGIIEVNKSLNPDASSAANRKQESASNARHLPAGISCPRHNELTNKQQHKHVHNTKWPVGFSAMRLGNKKMYNNNNTSQLRSRLAL